MDLKTAAGKPIHLRCPKCGHDLQFSGSKLINKRQELKIKISVCDSKIQARKNDLIKKKRPYKSDSYYNELIKRKLSLTAQLGDVKREIAIATEESERQLYSLFKKKLYKLYGQDTIVKILKECEDELSYNNYDMAIQKYTRFEGV